MTAEIGRAVVLWIVEWGGQSEKTEGIIRLRQKCAVEDKWKRLKNFR